MERLTSNVCQIFFFLHEPSHLKNDKCANLFVGNIDCIFFIMNWRFSSGRLAYTVGHFFQFLMIFIIELKCCRITVWNNIECWILLIFFKNHLLKWQPTLMKISTYNVCYISILFLQTKKIENYKSGNIFFR